MTQNEWFTPCERNVYVFLHRGHVACLISFEQKTKQHMGPFRISEGFFIRTIPETGINFLTEVNL